MANIPLLSLDSSESLGGSMGAAPSSSGNDQDAFDSLLREAGSALKDSSVEPERSDSLPVSKKSVDELAPDSSEPVPEGEEVKAVSAENPNDSEEVDSGDRNESSSDSQEQSKTSTVSERPSADDRNPVHNGQSPVAGNLAMIFIQNNESASSVEKPGVAAEKPGVENFGAPRAFLQGAQLDSTSLGVSTEGSEESSKVLVSREAVASFRPVDVQHALQGEAEGITRSATPAPVTLNSKNVSVPSPVPANEAPSTTPRPATLNSENVPTVSATSIEEPPPGIPQKVTLNSEKGSESSAIPVDGTPSATRKPVALNGEKGPAASVVPAIIQAKPLRGVSIEGKAAMPVPVHNAGQAGDSAPIELSGNVNAASIAAGTAPEEAEALAQFGQKTANANKFGKAAPKAAEPVMGSDTSGQEADIKNFQLNRTEINNVVSVKPVQAEGAGPLRDEAVVPLKSSPLGSPEGIVGTGETDALSARLESAADSRATLPQAGSQAESILKMQVQRQLLEATISRLNIALRDGTAQARIRLEPPSLGRMEIKLQVESSTLNAKVTVENAWVRDTVMSNLRELRETLQDQGVEVEQFTVDIDAGEDGKNPDGRFEDGAFGDEFLSTLGPNEESELAAIQAEGDIVPSAMGSGGTGSVDFFA